MKVILLKTYLSSYMYVSEFIMFEHLKTGIPVFFTAI